MFRVYTYGKVFIGERSTWAEAKELAERHTAKTLWQTYIYNPSHELVAIYHPNTTKREENKND